MKNLEIRITSCPFDITLDWSSHSGSALTNPTRSMRTQVQSLASLSGCWIQVLDCVASHRCGSDPKLLWLWSRPAPVAPIWPLTWDLPYAAGAALKRQNIYTSITLDHGLTGPPKDYLVVQDKAPLFGLPFIIRQGPDCCYLLIGRFLSFDANEFSVVER